MTTIIPGSRLAPRVLQAASGTVHTVPDAGHVTHLQFRRFTTCPNCQLHVHAYQQRRADLAAAGVQALIVFPAVPAADHEPDQPLPFIADSTGELYREFGIGAGWASVLHPGAWWPGIRGLFRFGIGLPPQVRDYLRFPAEFIIDRHGIVQHVHIGRHAADQWSVDHVIHLVSSLAR